MNKQAGFTLVEIAIVLVIIGLLLGGVLKGQELINNAKVKNLAADFRNIPLLVYGYQDKYRAIPGDDGGVDAHLGATACPATASCAASTPSGGQGNGMIEGWWNSTTTTDESFRFWQHVRLAGLTSGPTTIPTANTGDFLPKNADGFVLGLSGGSGAYKPIDTLNGAYVACSQGISGKLAKQLDLTLDDGDPAKGALQVMDNLSAPQSAVAKAKTTLDEATPYTVCMAF